MYVWMDKQNEISYDGIICTSSNLCTSFEAMLITCPIVTLLSVTWLSLKSYQIIIITTHNSRTHNYLRIYSTCQCNPDRASKLSSCKEDQIHK